MSASPADRVAGLVGPVLDCRERVKAMYNIKFNDGVYAALKLWVVFIVAFAVLGFRAEVSILFGAIAAAAWGSIVAYWNAQKLPDAPPKTSSEQVPGAARTSMRTVFGPQVPAGPVREVGSRLFERLRSLALREEEEQVKQQDAEVYRKLSPEGRLERLRIGTSGQRQRYTRIGKQPPRRIGD